MAEQTALLTAIDEPDERPVEEVRCCYTGVPIPTIPSWYAGVKVKFFSEASRKSGAAPLPIVDLETARLRTGGAGDGEDESGDDLDADLDLEDVDLELEEDIDEPEAE